MKITLTLIDKLLRLCDGETLPASQLRGEWVDEMLRDGILISTSHGSRRTIFAPDSDAFSKTLTVIDERFTNLQLLRETMLSEDASRSEQAYVTGNSKLVNVRSCPGFPVNSCEQIICKLHGRDFMLDPPEGSFVFISDWQSFSIPEDVLVVGIENMENFRMVRQQRELFEQVLGSCRFIFVSRYPQSTDLRSWLQTIPNCYVHFGDFDLSGIHIFLTEFRQYLGERATFFIPNDIEAHLKYGSIERYNDQYQCFHTLRSDIPQIQSLIDLINKHHRCYDQEGYIKIAN